MAHSGHDLLEGKTGVIFGALNESSLAWAIAQAVHREGGRFVLSNAPVAKRLGTLDLLADAPPEPETFAVPFEMVHGNRFER